MIMDILSERGYHVSSDSRTTETPLRIDLKTGEINVRKYDYRIWLLCYFGDVTDETRDGVLTQRQTNYFFNIRFQGHNIQPTPVGKIV